MQNETNLNMMVHCGGKEVERLALDTLEEPEGTRTHTPIPHKVLLETVENQLGDVGLRVIDEVHALNHEGAQYFGMLRVANGHEAADYSTVIGLRNSHDKTLPAGLVVGSGVFVCDNLAFSGEIKIGRKHTPNILHDLPYLTTHALLKVPGLIQAQHDRYEAYKATEIKPRYADALIMEMYRRGIINCQRIPKVLEQWENPDHEEHNQFGDSTWKLFNATTEALKGDTVTALQQLPQKTAKLHTLMDELTGQIGLAA